MHTTTASIPAASTPAASQPAASQPAASQPAASTPAASKSAAASTPAGPTHLRRLESPIGRIEVIGNGDAIVSLTIEKDGALPWDALPEQSDPILDRAAEQLGEYFDGHRQDFDLPLSLAGTAFQLAVWEQLVALDFGEVVSYGELGMATGRATAGRAVGGAVGANPIPIIIPCHRVLGSDGRITGYSGGEGIPTKSWLLDHEGIAHSVRRVSSDDQLDLGAFEPSAFEPSAIEVTAFEREAEEAELAAESVA